jgi:hypothetical protein
MSRPGLSFAGRYFIQDFLHILYIFRAVRSKIYICYLLIALGHAAGGAVG